MARGNAGSGISTVEEDIFEDVSGCVEHILPSDSTQIFEASFAANDASDPLSDAEFAQETDEYGNNLRNDLSTQLDRGINVADSATEIASSDFYTVMDSGPNSLHFSNNVYSGQDNGAADYGGGEVQSIDYGAARRMQNLPKATQERRSRSRE